MTCPLLLLGLLLIQLGLSAIISPVVAQSTDEKNAKADPETYVPRWVSYSTAECPNKIEGAGSRSDEPIEIDDFGSVISAARYWSGWEQDPEKWESYLGEGEAPPLDLHCRYIRISGHFRHRPYQHYRGVLAESARDLYLSGGLGNFIRERLYFIESWADKNSSSILLNGSDVVFVGQYYDLCRVARIEERKSDKPRIIMSGPCHYGDLTGQMLRDVAVVSSTNAFQRLRGEENRAVIGDLSQLPKTWPELKEARDAARSWIKSVRAGGQAYYLDRYGPTVTSYSERTRSSLLKRALEDRDDWIWFLAESPLSPLATRRPRIEDRSFAAFEITSFRRGINKDDVNAIVGCFCIAKSCEDDWPIRLDDAEYFFDRHICVELRRNRERPKEWRW